MWNSVINFFAHSAIPSRCFHWIVRRLVKDSTCIRRLQRPCVVKCAGLTGIVTRLLLDCCAPHSQDSDSLLRSVFSSRRAFIRHTNRVSFAIIVTHRIARAGRTVSLSIGRRWIAITLDPFRKRRMAQILLWSYHWEPLKLHYKWLNVKVIVNSTNLHSYAGTIILYYSFTTNKQCSSKYICP